METKQIIAIAVVAAIALAGAGAAFAYQATLNSSDNTVDAHYLEIGSTTGKYDEYFSYKVSSTAHPIDYDTVSVWDADSSKTVITHTPLEWNGTAYVEATQVVPGTEVKAVKVNANPFQMSVNSTSMAASDMFTLGVQVLYDADEDTEIDDPLDLQEKYWLYYTVNGIPGWIALNGTDVQKILVSDDNTFIHTGTEGTVLDIQFTLYAVEFTSNQGADVTQKVGYKDVDFKFTAVAEAQPVSQNKAIVTVQTSESAAVEGATAFYQTAKTDDGKGYGTLYLTKQTADVNEYTISNLPSTEGVAGAIKGTAVSPVQAVTPTHEGAAVTVVLDDS